jgi:hypothetical protein
MDDRARSAAPPEAKFGVGSGNTFLTAAIVEAFNDLPLQG